jgi:hypothetical protein
MSKATRALGPAKKLKPVLPVVIIGVVFAIPVTLTALVTGLVDRVPAVTAPITDWYIEPLELVFIVSLIVGAVVGVIYLFYRNNKEQIDSYWQQYSTWAKSMIAGTVSTVFGAIAFSIAYAIGWITLPTVGLGILITWPATVGLILLGYRKSSRAPNASASIKTAYVLTKGLESRTVSVIIGVLVATAVGLGVRAVGHWYFDRWPLWATSLVATFVLILVTVLAYNQYDKSKVERTDLTIVSIDTPESRECKEITIKNTSGDSVNLAESLIRDTDLDLYRPGFNYTLKPGQYGTFEIDDSFALEPNDDAIALPLGYDLKRGGETPAIFTKNSEIHYLQWTDEPAATIDRESSKHVNENVVVPNEDTQSPATRVSDPSPQD